MHFQIKYIQKKFNNKKGITTRSREKYRCIKINKGNELNYNNLEQQVLAELSKKLEEPAENIKILEIVKLN